MVYLPGMRHANQMHEPAIWVLTLLAGLLSHGSATNVACEQNTRCLMGNMLFSHDASVLAIRTRCHPAGLPPPTSGDVHHADALQWSTIRPKGS